jgi:DNA-binding transcriptional LysR family regulator
LVARSLGSAGWYLAATPAYLKKRGRPRSPDDLKKHDCLLFGASFDGAGVRLESAGKSVLVALAPRLLVTDMDILHAVATAGLGIGLLPAFRSMEALREGRIERVLPDWNAPSTPVHVVYPSTRHLSPKVKSFVDHLHQRMTPPSWELGPKP